MSSFWYIVPSFGSVACMFVIIWVAARNNFDSKELPSALLLSLLSLMIGFAIWGGAFAGSWDIKMADVPVADQWVYGYWLLFAVGSGAVPGVIVWAWVRFSLFMKVVLALNNAATWGMRLVQRIREAQARNRRAQMRSDENVLRRAREAVRLVKDIAQGTEWTLFNEELQEIVTGGIPRLLEQRRLLVYSIQDVELLVARDQAAEMNEQQALLLQETVNDLGTLQRKLAQTEESIDNVVSYLEHLRSGVFVAMHDDGARDEITRKTSHVSDSLSRQVRLIKESRQEVDTVGRKVIPLRSDDNS